MSLSLKFFCLLMVLGFAGLFVVKKPDGRPWSSPADFIPDSGTIAELIPDLDFKGVAVNSSADSVAVYRWQDSEGNWQYADSPPADTEAEQVWVNTHLNRDLAPEKVKVPTAQSSAQSKVHMIKDSNKTPSLLPSTPSPTTLSPDNIAKLVEDAKDIQNLVDQRKRLQDKTLGRD